MHIDQAEQERIRQAQQDFLARGGQIKKCPMHAQSTGQMRFNGARKRFKDKEEGEI